MRGENFDCFDKPEWDHYQVSFKKENYLTNVWICGYCNAQMKNEKLTPTNFLWICDEESVSNDIVIKELMRHVDVRRWEARSCADKRRDFRVINLDDPCLCGANVNNDEYCFNVESLFFGENLDAVSVDSDEAVYFASPNEIPSDHWMATMISIRVKLFEVKFLLCFVCCFCVAIPNLTCFVSV